MKQYFSLPLYVQGLKRVRGAGIASALVITVGNLIMPLGMLVSRTTADPANSASYAVELGEAMPVSHLILFLAPLIVGRMFSFLNKRSSSDFYHAIPQKRSCLYLSFTAAALTWIVGTLIISGAASFACWNLVPNMYLSLAVTARCVFSYTALGLLAAGCTLLASALTGNAFSCLFASVVILGLPALTLNAVGLYIGEFYDGFVFERSVFRYFGKNGFLPVANQESFYDPLGLAVLGAYAAFLLLAALGCVAFIRRGSETAEHSVSAPSLQHILRLSAALPIGLLVTGFAIDGYFTDSLPLVLIALVVYFLCELITTRSLDKAFKTLPMFLILPVICGLLAACAYGASAAVRAGNPKSADSVVCAYIEDADMYDFDGTAIDRLKGYRIENPEVIKALSDNFRFESSETGYRYATMKLVLKNGSVIYRKAYVDLQTVDELKKAVASDPQLLNELLWIPSYDEVTTYEPRYVWEAFEREYAALNDEQKLSVICFDIFDYNGEEATLYAYKNGQNGERYTYCFKLDEKLFPETVKLLLEEE